MSAVFADALDQKAWERWVSYRKAIKKALKPVSYPAAQRKLASFGDQQQAVVEQSIANGWQGLFPLKKVADGKDANGRKPSAVERAQRATGGGF